MSVYPEAMVAILRRRAPYVVKIALETAPMSAWHYRSLVALGLPFICIDARHAQAAPSMQLNKIDANDAVGLAQIVRTGWCREIAVKSDHSHERRARSEAPTAAAPESISLEMMAALEAAAALSDDPIDTSDADAREVLD